MSIILTDTSEHRMQAARSLHEVARRDPDILLASANAKDNEVFPVHSAFLSELTEYFDAIPANNRGRKIIYGVNSRILRDILNLLYDGKVLMHPAEVLIFRKGLYLCRLNTALEWFYTGTIVNKGKVMTDPEHSDSGKGSSESALASKSDTGGSDDGGKDDNEDWKLLLQTTDVGVSSLEVDNLPAKDLTTRIKRVVYNPTDSTQFGKHDIIRRLEHYDSDGLLHFRQSDSKNVKKSERHWESNTSGGSRRKDIQKKKKARMARRRELRNLWERKTFYWNCNVDAWLNPGADSRFLGLGVDSVPISSRFTGNDVSVTQEHSTRLRVQLSPMVGESENWLPRKN